MVRGYVLISVLLGLVLLTTLLVSAQRLSVRTSAELIIAAQSSDTSDFLASILALASELEPSDDPLYLDEFNLWLRLQPSRGLVDLNSAPEELVLAVFSVEGMDTSEVASRLHQQRASTDSFFVSLSHAFDQLGIPEEKQSVLSLYTTVATKNESVDPSDAAPEISGLLTKIMAHLEIDPLEQDVKNVFRVSISFDPLDLFKPLFYIKEIEPGVMRLHSVLAGQ